MRLFLLDFDDFCNCIDIIFYFSFFIFFTFVILHIYEECIRLVF